MVVYPKKRSVGHPAHESAAGILDRLWGRSSKKPTVTDPENPPEIANPKKGLPELNQDVPTSKYSLGDEDSRNRMEITPIRLPKDLEEITIDGGNRHAKVDKKRASKKRASKKKASSGKADVKKNDEREDDEREDDERRAYRKEQLQKHDFKPQVSSFVLATNNFGDFSKCTIISELVTSGDLKNDIAKRAEKVWRLFVHQPQSGRCLVFFEVLKVVTRKITLQYRKALNVLESVLELDV